MNIVENLKSRFPADDPAVADLKTAFENAASFVPVAGEKRAEFAGNKNLSAEGVSDAVRRFLAIGVVPELRRAEALVAQKREALQESRSKAGQPQIDRSDEMAAAHRKEAREYLRSLSHGERAALLTSDPDPLFLEAALEVPNALTGINDEVREHVQIVFAKRFNPQILAQIDNRSEALSALEGMIGIAKIEMQKSTGLDDREFATWFQTAEAREAA